MNSVNHLLKVKWWLRDPALSPGESLTGPLLLLPAVPQSWDSQISIANPSLQETVSSLCHPQQSQEHHTSHAHMLGTYFRSYPVSHLSTHYLCLGLHWEVLTFIKNISPQPHSPSGLKLSIGWLDADWQLIPATCYRQQFVAHNYSVHHELGNTYSTHMGIYSSAELPLACTCVTNLPLYIFQVICVKITILLIQ